MIQAVNRKRLVLLTAFAVGSSYYLLNSDIDLQRDSVTLNNNASKRSQGLRDVLPLSAATFASAASANNPSVLKGQPNLVKRDEMSKGIPENKLKLSRYFYDKFLHTKSISEKMDNLRWAYEQFSETLSPEEIAKAANALGLDKKDLIDVMNETALAFFKESKVDPAKSRYGQLAFWNDLRLAYQYAGITETGEYDESPAQNKTGYSYDNIVATRDTYTITATSEVMKDILAANNSLQEKYESLSKEIPDSYDDMIKILDKTDLEDRKSTLNKIELMLYTIAQLNKTSRSDQNLALFNLTRDQYESIYNLKKYLDDSIGLTLTELAREHAKNPGMMTDSEPVAATNSQPAKFPDLIYIMNGHLFYKGPK